MFLRSSLHEKQRSSELLSFFLKDGIGRRVGQHRLWVCTRYGGCVNRWRVQSCNERMTHRSRTGIHAIHATQAQNMTSLQALGSPAVQPGRQPTHYLAGRALPCASRFMRAYPVPNQAELIFDAIVKALGNGLDPDQMRKDAAALKEWAEGKTEADVLELIKGDDRR